MTEELAKYVKCKQDPWYFLSTYVFTLDQVDKKHPIKKFPSDRKYLYLFTRAWQEGNLWLIPKSRRMTMSWTLIGLYVWDTIFFQGRFNAFVSKKEDDANELVDRADFIIANLEKAGFPKEFIPERKKTFCRLDFPELKSKIWGFPQGADQLRQFTFSGILGDECAFWEKAQEFYSASFPTIDGGGRMSLVSSPAPGFFKKLCYDALDVIGEINVAEYVPDYQTPVQGVKIWKNKKNKFHVFELHYSADPQKRSEAYRESIKASMPVQEYMREYELTWDTFAGQPVYPEFSDVHILSKAPVAQPGLPLLLGLDFGLTPAAIIGQYREGQLVILKEYVEVNMGVERFLEMIVPEIRLLWPEWGDFRKNWRCYIDPAGLAKSQTDETTCAQVVASAGFAPYPGPITFQERRHNVVEFLRRLTPQGPALQVYEKGCPVLVRGFKGGYRYADKSLEIEPTRILPLKDAFSHPHDALQYLVAGVVGLTKTARKAIPTPSYSTTKKSTGDTKWLKRA